MAAAAARRHEIAVRASLGAGARIIRQLLTESLLLAAIGGGFGVLIGYWGLGILLRFIPPNVPRLQDVSLDARVFIFTALISILTGVLFGLVPAWQASRVNLGEALKEAGRSNSGGRGIRNHSLLVTAEVALAAILLIGAALMLQSFRRLLSVDPGFKAEGVATFEVTLPWARFDGQSEANSSMSRLQLGSLPGVRAVGVILNLPLGGNENDFFHRRRGPGAPRQRTGSGRPTDYPRLFWLMADPDQRTRFRCARQRRQAACGYRQRTARPAFFPGR
jgi:hypothetical protein